MPRTKKSDTKPPQQEEMETEITRRLDMNSTLLERIRQHMGSEGDITLLGNAAYHTSVTTNQPVLEILGTVATFLIWVKKIQDIQQKGDPSHVQKTDEGEDAPTLF